MTDEAMSPLRRRMIEDMTIRKLAPRPNKATSAPSRILPRSSPIARQGEFRGRPTLSAASGEERRACADSQSHRAALRFFFRVTLKRSDIIEHTTFLHEPRKKQGKGARTVT